MSQTTFLESVVSWDHQKCLQNLDEALPKLISCLQATEIVQEQVGVLKIICQLFLPCIQIEQTENKLFKHITKEACASFDTILNDIKQLKKDEDIQTVTTQVLGLLELLSDILECYEVCVKYVGSIENTIAWNLVQSLPTGAIHILKRTYGHCKDSSELYGELLVHVSEPLSALFRKAHSLQVALLNLLDKLTLEGAGTDKDVEDICLVCYGLFEVCQIVTSLDVKLVVTLWKAISKHVIQKKELLKHQLNVDEMVKHLCTEIINGYTYLFQLLPHVDDDGIILSQGDEKGFQKSVKILGFQMKITVSLVREYKDYLSDCGSDLYTVLIHLQRMMPPCIHRQQIQDHHGDEIRRQLLNATEPLVTSSLTNTKFIESLTSKITVDNLTETDSLPHLLLTLIVMDSVPKLTDDEKERWLSPHNYREDISRHSLISCVFHVLNKCFLEMTLPVYVPGMSSTNKKERQVCLYDEVCVHFCGFIGSLPAKYFEKMEEVLIENVLNTDPVSSQLATDTWCFLVRYGSAELCDSHVKVVLEMLKEIPGYTIQHRNLVILVNRMIKFLAKEHQVEILKTYPPSSHVTLWSHLSISGFTSTNARNLVDSLTSQCIKLMHNFINTSEKRAESFVNLNSALDGLLNIFSESEIVDKYLLPDVQSAIVDKTIKLCNNFSDWSVILLTTVCFGKLLQLFGFILQNTNNKEILQILQIISTVIKQSSNQHLKLSVAKFLQQLRKVKLTPSFEQNQILTKIPVIFNSLLCDTDYVVHHVTLEAFTKFAEVTIHESIVPQCIQDNTKLQDSVVAFLNKTPYPSTVKRQEYITKMLQYTGTEEMDTQEPCSKRQRTEEEVNSLATNKHQGLIEALTLCIQGLKDNGQTIPSYLTKTLTETRYMITVLLDENG